MRAGEQPSGTRAPLTRRAPLADFEGEIGFAFTARTGHPELSAHDGPSPAVVLEDGRPLRGPANAQHDEIRRVGGGAYSFWYDFVYVSTSDNSDPRTNGRRYEIEYPIGRLRDTALRLRDALGLARVPRAPARGGDHGADVQLGIWKRLGFTPGPDSVLLDFGCGAGQRVHAFRQRGFQASGCDVALPSRPTGSLRDSIDAGVIRQIGSRPYRLPFDDNTFDMIFSVTVFEHVMDYDSTLAEIRRVLKPDGISVHAFPGPWKPIETHLFVPWASKIQAYWWLYLWAAAGVRNQYQGGFTAKRTADVNHAFLKHETNYLSQRQIREHASRHFDECRFVEEAAFSPPRHAFFQRHPRLLPLYRRWFSETYGRLLVLGRKRR